MIEELIPLTPDLLRDLRAFNEEVAAALRLDAEFLSTPLRERSAWHLLLDDQSRLFIHELTRNQFGVPYPFTTERERISSVDQMLRPMAVRGRWQQPQPHLLFEAGYFGPDEIVENMMRMEAPE